MANETLTAIAPPPPSSSASLPSLSSLLHCRHTIGLHADSRITLSCLAQDADEGRKINRQESDLESSLCTAIFKLLILKDLVALTGIERANSQFSTVQLSL